jgi:hypothetical protein
MSSRPRKTIDVSLLLSYEEIDRYCDWQDCKSDPDNSGTFTSAVEYHEFMNRISDRKSPWTVTESDAIVSLLAGEATHCGHKIHPETAAAPGYCPVCRMWFCIEFLGAIQLKWGESQEQGMAAEVAGLRSAWRTARLEMQTLVDCYEAEAEVEKKSAMDNLGGEDYRKTTNSATAALELMYKCYAYPASYAPPTKLAPRDRVMSGTKEAEKQQRHRKKKKTVHWVKDVQVYEPRHRHQYLRRHPQAYSPGRHAASPEHEWEDTSFYCDMTYARRQCKVFFTTAKEAERLHIEHPESWPEFEGLAALHPKAEMIENFMEKVLGRMPPKEMETFLMKAATSHGIALFLSQTRHKILGCRNLTWDLPGDSTDVDDPSVRDYGWVTIHSCKSN